MSNVCMPFEGKKITVMGLGLLGRGVGDVEFLANCGAEIVVTDKKTSDELAVSVKKLEHFKNVAFHLGGHDMADFTDADMVLKAAGVPLNSPEIAAAQKAGVPVMMSTALFAKYASEMGATIVGVTGTRAKSTVTHMIYRTLVRAGKHALLGGNIRGKSTLAMLHSVKKGDVAVLELDSWQLQGFGELKISPHIAVVTNLSADHLNYYPDMETYFADKTNIFKFQTKDDKLIVGTSIAERVAATKPSVGAMTPVPLPHDWKLRVVGEHNRENAALAAAVLMALGLSDEEVKDGLESFEGVEGRLQFLRDVNGVKIYNDNNSTTPTATIAALRAVGDQHKKGVVLIMGGDDKGLDMSELIQEIPKWCSKVVLFKERGSERIREDIFALQPAVQVYEEEGLKATVVRAFQVAEPGETVLYSPAFASFGKYFKNEFDRNDQFLKIVSAV